jgi:hypothetical protein
MQRFKNYFKMTLNVENHVKMWKSVVEKTGK